jgi:hypothetical protein
VTASSLIGRLGGPKVAQAWKGSPMPQPAIGNSGQGNQNPCREADDRPDGHEQRVDDGGGGIGRHLGLR